MIVDCALYRDGVRVPLEVGNDDLAAVRDARHGEGDFIWVGLHDPDQAQLDQVAKLFELHPLAVEDALHAHQRPKLERYDDDLFLVLKTLWYVDELDAVETGEINLFLGHDFVVSVRHGEGTELSSRPTATSSGAAELLSHGPSAVVYAICDRVVDGYEEVAALRWRSTSTRWSSRCSPPSAATTRRGSTSSNGRSPRCAGQSPR